jgi:hypothetical protein
MLCIGTSFALGGFEGCDLIPSGPFSRFLLREKVIGAMVAPGFATSVTAG